MKKFKKTIEFSVTVDEGLALTIYSKEMGGSSRKELFSTKNSFWYLSRTSGKGDIDMHLRQVTEEEYRLRCNDILNRLPETGETKWTKDGKDFQFTKLDGEIWSRRLADATVTFITQDNPLFEQREELLSVRKKYHQQIEGLSNGDKREYARQCGLLASQTGVSYLNVMRIGPERDKVVEFRDAYRRVIEALPEKPLAWQRALYVDMFRTGRKTRESALARLEIPYFSAEIMRLDFSELEEILKENLSRYEEESITKAIDTALGKDYETRQRYYAVLCNNNARPHRRELLVELGVEIEALDMANYPMDKLKKAVASSLGLGAMA